MKSLRERGYVYPRELAYNREDYRVRAAFMLENNGLLPETAQPITIEILEELYYEEYGLRFKYVKDLLERCNAYGAASRFKGESPQILLDESLQNHSKPSMNILLRSTASHELAHALMHSEDLCFRSAARVSSFSCYMDQEDREDKSWLQYCQRKPQWETPVSSDRFLEFQANQMMVGLLMPFNTLYPHAAKTAELKLEMLKYEYGWNPSYALKAREDEIFDFMVTQIASCYNVGKKMAAIELYRLYMDRELTRIFRGIAPADPIQKKPIVQSRFYE